MLLGVQQLLYTMTPAQREVCQFPMDDPARLDWDFIPKPDRTGLQLGDMDRHQRTLMHVLLKSALSMRGYTQALEIMAMENVLRELETPLWGIYAGDLRNSDAYHFSVFGRPGFEESWGWRFLGHHLSLSYTIVGQHWLSVTPSNMGSQPAGMGTLTPLQVDEDLGFEIFRSLTDEQRGHVHIHNVAPADYATRQVPRIGKVEYPDYVDLGLPWYTIEDEDREALKFEKDNPRGLPGSELGKASSTLIDLVGSFVGRMPEEVADAHMQRINGDGLENIWFCWAGGVEKGTPHYYRIQGKRFLIEFDNAVDSGNHIHSVWRDYQNDLGHQLLLDHYEHQDHHGHHLDTRLKSTVPEDD
jgi:hypothetical protein